MPLLGVDLEKRIKALFAREKAGTDTEELFRILAGNMSTEEMNSLSPNARAAVMTDRLHKGFTPIGNVLGRSPQALAGRLAVRGATSVAETFANKDEIKEVADRGLEEYEEYIREIVDTVGTTENPNPGETINGRNLMDGLPKDMVKRYQEINNGRPRAATPVMEQASKKLTEELAKVAKKKAAEKAKEVIGSAVAKGVTNLATNLHIRSAGNERYRNRRDEARAQEDGPEVQQRFRDILAEQFVPGSRFADEKGGLTYRMLAGARAKK